MAKLKTEITFPAAPLDSGTATHFTIIDESVCPADPAWSVRLQQQAYAMGEETEKLRADNARLRAALTEIARPKRGGIEANDSDEEWIEYLRKALEREQSTARAALTEVK